MTKEEFFKILNKEKINAMAVNDTYKHYGNTTTQSLYFILQD